VNQIFLNAFAEKRYFKEVPFIYLLKSQLTTLKAILPQSNTQRELVNLSIDGVKSSKDSKVPQYPKVDSWNGISVHNKNWGSLDNVLLERNPSRKYAIVVIDIQKEFTQFNKKEQDQKVQNVKRLIHANFKKNQISLVEYDVDAKANTEKSLIEGLEGISFRENNLINNSKNFSYYRKSTDGAFDSTKIAEDLKKQGVTDIILAGLNEEACVYETALGALKKGFNIITSPSITFNTYNTEPLSSFYSITGNVFQKQNDIQTLLDNNLFVKEPSKR
jgi:hypothetical protein